MYCVVKDCPSVWNPTSNVIFHSFPKDSEKRQKWLSVIPLKGKFYESAKICGLHFKPENYDPLRPKRLLNSAVPVYSVQLCSCGNNVMACKTPFKCLVSSNAMIPTETDTCSTVSGKEHSYCEKDIHIIQNENIASTAPFKCSASSNETIPTHNTHSENIVVNENEPPVKRRRFQDFNVQCKIKSLREKCLKKKKKILQQKVARNEQKIKDLKSLVNIVRNYTSQSEIENILQGNFADICKHFNKKTKVTSRYSDEVKSFALTMHFYSPKAYAYLRTIMSLPHSTTLWRSISSFNCSVGFLNEVFEYLKLQLPEKKHLKNVALIFDSMNLKQDIAYSPKLGKVFGYVDLGSIPVSDPEQLASKALVFMIVSYTNYLNVRLDIFLPQAVYLGIY